MSRSVVAVAWYRFRATFRRRWGGYLALVLLVGLVGGLAMGAVAGARRTQSSFPNFWAGTRPSDLVGVNSILNPQLGQNAGYNAGLVQRIARLPHVTEVQSEAGIDFLALGRNGAPVNIPGLTFSAGNGYGSVDGLYFDQDRVTPISGRLPDSRNPDEFVATASVAQGFGWRLGQVVPLGIYTNAQTTLPSFGTAAVVPYRRLQAKLVGIVVLNVAVVQDDVDAGNSASTIIFTPALTQGLLGCCVNYAESAVRVDRPANIAAVAAAIDSLLPKGFPPFTSTASVPAKAERAIKPEAIALAVFGGIAGLAALVIAAQVIGRQLRVDDEDRKVLQAIGAGPVTTTIDGLVGILGAAVGGAVVAVAVAVALSPLTPFGPVRTVEAGRGVTLDGAVLGLGSAALVVALAAVAVALCVRAAPHRVALRRQRSDGRGSSLARAAASAGLPVPAVAGIRFALEPGSGRTSVPVRSAIVGAILAVVVVVATTTFGASLDALVSHPALYGWNWDTALVSGGDIPQQQITQLLDRDPDVAAWSGIYTASLHIDGQPTAVVGEDPGTIVQPPTLTGHSLQAADEIVLGTLTLGQLHRSIGDTVTVNSGLQAPTRLRIVGTATLPALGSNGGPHLEMGTGAVVPTAVIPAAARNPFANPVTGPNAVLIRFHPGADRAAATRRLQTIATATTNNFNFGDAVVPLLRPAEIVNYRSMGTTPTLLGVALATGAAVALGLTLVASVRRRRRDLALLKALGFTRRQLATVVAWQSTVAVAIGTVVGVPLGIALGRVLWNAFAAEIDAVPSPSVPALSILLIILGAFVLANVVAALPGRQAARTPTALVLRAE